MILLHSPRWLISDNSVFYSNALGFRVHIFDLSFPKESPTASALFLYALEVELRGSGVLRKFLRVCSGGFSSRTCSYSLRGLHLTASALVHRHNPFDPCHDPLWKVLSLPSVYREGKRL